MKYIALAFLFITLSCSKKPDHSKDIEAIKKVLSDQTEAWNQGDLDGFMKGYWNSDKLKFIVKGTIRRGYELVLASYKKSYPDKDMIGHLDFSHLEVEPMDDAATIYNVTGNWEVTGDKAGKGNFSLIFKNINGQWLIIEDHTF